RLEQLRSRPVLARPSTVIDSRAEELERYLGRGGELLGLMVERAQNRVGELRGQLRALSPQRTLDRGYAIAQLPDGAVLRRAEDAPEGTELLLTLAEGGIGARVTAPESPGRDDG